MEKIVLLNECNEKNLLKVIEQMKIMGSPTIRVYDLGFDNLSQAIEGSHRLRACEILNITPNIEWIDPNTIIGDLDLIDTDCDPEKPVSTLGDWENYNIEFDI
jgi:hypothetical protein